MTIIFQKGLCYGRLPIWCSVIRGIFMIRIYFCLERWEEEGVKQIPKYAYFPFGGGARMCIGEGFAWMEGILVLAAILQKVKFENIGEAPIEIDPVFSLRTKPDLKLKIQLL
ncbi:MAG: cytochrome P450 [Bacteroidia bacterium]